MLQDGRKILVLSLALTIFAGGVFGRQRQTQPPGSAKHAGTAIRSNSQNAVVLMRTVCSAEVAYRNSAGNGDYGTVADLFRNDLIDAGLANAMGCPEMKSGQGRMCAGTGATLRGYNFQLKITPSAPERPSAFTAVGIPHMPYDTERAGDYSFFVDQSQVIRVSDNPAVTANAASPALGSSRVPEIR